MITFSILKVREAINFNRKTLQVLLFVDAATASTLRVLRTEKMRDRRA